MLQAASAAIVMMVLVPMTVAAERESERKPMRLPEPLEGVAVDLSLFEQDFKLVKVEYFQSGEFSTPDPRPRVVAEETLVWTLEAVRAVEGRRLAGLLSNPFPRVRFRKRQEGQEVSADGRERGYGLFHDGRWLGRKGPDLKTGERLRVWTHLGREGSAALLRAGAKRVVFVKEEGEAKENEK